MHCAIAMCTLYVFIIYRVSNSQKLRILYSIINMKVKIEIQNLLIRIINKSVFAQF